MKIILENAVAALKAEAQRIEVAIHHLTGIIGGTGTATASSAPPAEPVKRTVRRAKAEKPAAAPKAKRKYTRRAPAADAPPVAPVLSAHKTVDSLDHWTPKTGSITHNVLVALSKAPEPFSVASLLVVLPDMDKAVLGTELWKLGRAGYVVEAGKEGNAKLYKRGQRTIVAA